MKFYDELKYRGLIESVTSPEVEEKLNNGGLNFYIGTDPTADSTFILEGVLLKSVEALPVVVKELVFLGEKPYSIGNLKVLSLAKLWELEFTQILFTALLFNKQEAIISASVKDAQALYIPKNGISLFLNAKCDAKSWDWRSLEINKSIFSFFNLLFFKSKLKLVFCKKLSASSTDFSS